MTREDLKIMQAWPLERKIQVTQTRIIEWYTKHNGMVYVSFSGGKDSTVLLDLVRRIFPDVPAVFADTGLEYPEIKKFVAEFDNVENIKPVHRNKEVNFSWVIQNYGYPIISKEISDTIHGARLGQKFRSNKINGTMKNPTNGEKSNLCCDKYKPLLVVPIKISAHCCEKMKKSPMNTYYIKMGRFPITGEMADESRQRRTQWLNNGCNGFNMKIPKSTPMAFWTEQDVLQYIKLFNIPIASVYSSIEYAEQPEQMRLSNYAGESVVPNSEKLRCTGCQRTGCIFCAFGAHLEKGEGRFVRLKRTHPKQYEYCMGGGEFVNRMWQPNKKGLGMAYVFDTVNEIYGKDFIKY